MHLHGIEVVEVFLIDFIIAESDFLPQCLTKSKDNTGRRIVLRRYRRMP